MLDTVSNAFRDSNTSNFINIEASNILEKKIKDSIEIYLERLNLRNVRIEDANDILELGGDFAVAEMMNGSIPSPYLESMARDWIIKHQDDSIGSLAISWAIALKEHDILIGSIQIRKEDFKSGRLSYWIGKPYWNKGFASEAIHGIIKFCFDALCLEQINAEHFKKNPASGKVLQKAGFSYLGSIKKIDKLSDCQEDFEQYCLKKESYFLHFQ